METNQNQRKICESQQKPTKSNEKSPTKSNGKEWGKCSIFKCTAGERASIFAEEKLKKCKEAGFSGAMTSTVELWNKKFEK